MLKKIWQWIVYSSENAERYSLMIKGLAGFIPAAVLFFAFFHIDVSEVDLSSLIDSAASGIIAAGALFSAVTTIIGFIRKVIRTAIGTNQVVLGWRR